MPSEELFDLHCHSTRSDGLKSPLELARHARLCGLAGIAITDHDTLPPISLWETISTLTGQELITGVELTVKFGGRTLHLLGYGFCSPCESLNRICEALRSQRRCRWDYLVERSRDRGVRWDDAHLSMIQEQGTPCRKHLARELIRLKKATTSRAAFAKYLELESGEGPDVGVDLTTAIQAIHDAGGIAIFAHPPTGLSAEYWRSLAATNLDGLETRFGKVNRAHQQFLEERAKEYGWVTSAGSDYHGDSASHRLGQHHVTREGLNALLACGSFSRP